MRRIEDDVNGGNTHDGGRGVDSVELLKQVKKTLNL